MRSIFGWMVVSLLVLVVGSAWLWQRLEMTRLHNELFVLRETQDETTRLRTENRRLMADDATDIERAHLLAAHDQVLALRAELAALRARDEAARVVPVESGVAERFAVGAIMPSTEWRNMGASTPAAVLETALWAAAGGDVNTFAKCLRLEPDARVAARSLLANLPEAMRSQFGTPEQLMAFLTIKDVPLGSAKVRDWTGGIIPTDPIAASRVLFTSPDGKINDVQLIFMRVGEEWKLNMRQAAVEKYSTALKGSLVEAP